MPKNTINNKMNNLKTRRIKLITYSIYIVLIDQISKFLVLKTIGFDRSKNVIPNILNFTLVKNKGAAFSLFSNSTSFLTILSVFASLLLITFILKFQPRSYWNSLGLVYLLGGTVGNGIDRLFKGYVIDFFELVPIHFAIFNVADISINIAIICFMIAIFIEKNKSWGIKK
tara:strand:+ start:244 stop:756 length:513 start_codon:yes stop_codon:yes gene_type:complete